MNHSQNEQMALIPVLIWMSSCLPFWPSHFVWSIPRTVLFGCIFWLNILHRAVACLDLWNAVLAVIRVRKLWIESSIKERLGRNKRSQWERKRIRAREGKFFSFCSFSFFLWLQAAQQNNEGIEAAVRGEMMLLQTKWISLLFGAGSDVGGQVCFSKTEADMEKGKKSWSTLATASCLTLIGEKEVGFWCTGFVVRILNVKVFVMNTQFEPRRNVTYFDFTFFWLTLVNKRETNSVALFQNVLCSSDPQRHLKTQPLRKEGFLWERPHSMLQTFRYVSLFFPYRTVRSRRKLLTFLS